MWASSHRPKGETVCWSSLRARRRRVVRRDDQVRSRGLSLGINDQRPIRLLSVEPGDSGDFGHQKTILPLPSPNRCGMIEFGGTSNEFKTCNHDFWVFSWGNIGHCVLSLTKTTTGREQRHHSRCRQDSDAAVPLTRRNECSRRSTADHAGFAG
jgi:hypothetical protein